MGIKNLNPFIKDIKKGEIHHTGSFSDLSRKRVAIDASLWAIASMFTSMKKIINNCDIVRLVLESKSNKPREIIGERIVISGLINILLEDLDIFISRDITPVFVFDGESPKEKEKTKMERKKVYEKNKIKFEQGLEEVRKCDLDNNIDITKIFLQMNYLSSDDTNIIKTVLYNLGIPYIQAKGEAEKLCSMLINENIISAVVSTDTDNLVYGCEYLITNYNKWNYKYVLLSDVLDILDINHRTFVDLCIMAKCDYNDNIPNLAIKKAYKLLKQEETIENLIENKKIQKYECLNHERCRELFSKEPYETLIEEGNYNISRNRENDIRDFLEKISMNELFDKLYQKINIMQPVKNLIIKQVK